ncbi:DUF4350 domain-containing protein [Kitasatospora sp. NPDC049285]|uniref:DUF4350 domain-containing protein n=1 Tax=Kitasatospora sp. NPDC049285 TaxID=3157096 RepID=UPI00342E49EE
MTTTAPPPATAEPAPADAPAAEPAPRPTARTLWRRWRWYLLSAAILLLVGVLVAAIPGGGTYPPLDPRSGDKDGTLAAVRLLERHGVTTRTVTTEADLAAALRADDTTVVLPGTDLMSYGELNRLGTVPRGNRSRLVLLAPGQPALDAFAPGITVRYADTTDTLTTPATCTLPEAALAGSAELGGRSYRHRTSDTGCYPRHGNDTLVSRTEKDRQVIVTGTADTFSNARLDQEGNASLALGLLGAHRTLVWHLPDHSLPDDASVPGQKTLTDFVPAGWYWAALQLTVAALLAVVWRARRLGPVLTEQLPVVVRATETTEGRARLYQRAKARGHAADTLRRATRHRLATALGVPLHSGDPEPAALTEAATTRTGRPAADLQHLLYGPAPTDDAALVRLTDDLDALERQVRHS